MACLGGSGGRLPPTRIRLHPIHEAREELVANAKSSVAVARNGKRLEATAPAFRADGVDVPAERKAQIGDPLFRMRR